MAISSMLWKFASPYDAYISHVARLNDALRTVRHLSDRAAGAQAGLHGSMRYGPGASDQEARVRAFRERLGRAAATMSDEDFEDFVAQLGGGRAADIEADRANAARRLSMATRGLEEYLAIAGQQLATLDARGYNPARPDVARQLRDNELPAYTIFEYRRILHELGTRAGLPPQG